MAQVNFYETENWVIWSVVFLTARGVFTLSIYHPTSKSKGRYPLCVSISDKGDLTSPCSLKKVIIYRTNIKRPSGSLLSINDVLKATPNKSHLELPSCSNIKMIKADYISCLISTKGFFANLSSILTDHCSEIQFKLRQGGSQGTFPSLLSVPHLTRPFPQSLPPSLIPLDLSFPKSPN